jgi:hypothetical protein
LLKERDASIKILENLTGKINLNKRKNEQQTKKIGMMRYDPSKEESKELEVNKIKHTATKPKSKRPNEDDTDDEKKPDSHIDLNRYYDIKPDIKTAFNSNELFTFKFSSSASKTSEPKTIERDQADETPKAGQKFKSYSYLNDNMYKSSSSSESEFQDDDDDHCDNHADSTRQTKLSETKKTESKRLFADKAVEFGEAPFIPAINDKQIQGYLAKILKKIFKFKKIFFQQKPYLFSCAPTMTRPFAVSGRKREKLWFW